MTEVLVDEGGRPAILPLLSCSHRFRLLRPFGNSPEFLRFVQRACETSGSWLLLCERNKEPLSWSRNGHLPVLGQESACVRARVCAPVGRRGAGLPGSRGSHPRPHLPPHPSHCLVAFLRCGSTGPYGMRGIDWRPRVCTSVGRERTPAT